MSKEEEQSNKPWLVGVNPLEAVHQSNRWIREIHQQHQAQDLALELLQLAHQSLESYHGSTKLQTNYSL